MNKQLVRFMFNLEELIESSNEIYIIGHNDPDYDAIGAALGMTELCYALNKDSKIIMNEDKFTLQPSVKLLQDMNANRNFINLEGYIKELEEKVSPDELIDHLTSEEKEGLLKNIKINGRILIIVDTNNPKLLCIKDYLNNFDKIVVIDHHKELHDPLLESSYHFIDDTYSSACEIVGTLLHHYEVSYSKELAIALASGIVLDTDTFKRNTTDNTYNTYSVFKKNRVSDEDIRRLFRKDFEADKLVKNLVFNNGNAKEFTNLLKNHNVSIILNREHPETIYRSELISMAADERQEYDDVDASIVMGYICSPTGIPSVKISVRTNGYVDGGRLMEKYCENDEKKSGGGGISSAAAVIKEADLLDEEQSLITFLDNVITDDFRAKKKVKKLV